MLYSWSSCGQQRAVKLDALVRSEGVDEEEKCLNPFGSSISVAVYYAFLDYRVRCGNDGIVDGSIMQLKVLYALVVPVLK